MFGIISHSGLGGKSKVDFNKNYCGTCKTISNLFSNRDRIFLNNDIVFLCELLQNISNISIDNITVGNCFSIPKIEKIPDFMQFAASLNLFLAYHKIEDNFFDSKNKINFWRIILRFYNKNYRKAKIILSSYGLNVNNIINIIRLQRKRENSPKQFEDLQQCLDHYSETTAIITSKVFRTSLNTIGRKDLIPIFESLGFEIGKLVYVFDAKLDFYKDSTNNSFNPLFHCNKAISMEVKMKIIDYYISDILNRIMVTFDSLGIEENQAEVFKTRIKNGIINKNSKKEYGNIFPKDFAYRFKYIFLHTKKFVNNFNSKSKILNKSLPVMLFPFFIFRFLFSSTSTVYSGLDLDLLIVHNISYDDNCCTNFTDDCCAYCCEPDNGGVSCGKLCWESICCFLGLTGVLAACASAEVACCGDSCNKSESSNEKEVIVVYRDRPSDSGCNNC